MTDLLHLPETATGSPPTQQPGPALPDWRSLHFDPANLPLRIAICGFAPSRVQTPWGQDGWEYWGVNDLYFHQPGQIHRTFELHALTGLLENGRRNPQYVEWLRKGKMPTYMAAPHPEFPAAVRFPYEWLAECFPRRYFTNSISWMTGLAVMLLTEPAQTSDGRPFRLARAGAQIAFWGVDMASSGSADRPGEYEAQRPSCEYMIGLAEGCGVGVFIPDTSDLCKTGALYGLDTTLPLRQKLELKIAQTQQVSQQADQQLAALQAQREQVLYNKGRADGERSGYKYVRGVFTNPNEVAPSAEERDARHGVSSSAARLASGNGVAPNQEG